MVGTASYEFVMKTQTAVNGMIKCVPYSLSWLKNRAVFDTVNGKLPAGLDYTLVLSPFCYVQNILAAITEVLSYFSYKNSKMDYSLKSKNKDRLESYQEFRKSIHY